MQCYTEQEKYWIWLSYVPEMTPKLFYNILKEFGDAQGFFDAVKNSSASLEKMPEKLNAAAMAACSQQRAAEIISELNSKGIRAFTRLSSDYPQMLKSIPYPPPVLFYKGKLSGLFDSEDTSGYGGGAPENQRFLESISIVGTRRCTRKGADLAYAIAKELAAAGVTVVSGMARGIDAAAHMGALDAKGKTVAVLGCGADVVYPPENEELYHKIIESGALISELPAQTQPLAENFPIRNRIIAGLSRGTLVVESEEEGGTAITASMAISFGRDVFAVPGAPYNCMAALSNMLIGQGAYPVSCAADIQKVYGLFPDKAAEEDSIKQIQLDFLQRQIYNLLLQGDASVESMAKSIEYPQNEINAAITLMEIVGIIKRSPGGKYGI